MTNPDSAQPSAERQAALRDRRDPAERQVRILGDVLEVNPTVSLMIRCWFARRAFEHTSWLLEQAEELAREEAPVESHAAAEHKSQHERAGGDVRNEGEREESLIRQRLPRTTAVPLARLVECERAEGSADDLRALPDAGAGSRPLRPSRVAGVPAA